MVAFFFETPLFRHFYLGFRSILCDHTSNHCAMWFSIGAPVLTFFSVNEVLFPLEEFQQKPRGFDWYQNQVLLWLSLLHQVLLYVPPQCRKSREYSTYRCICFTSIIQSNVSLNTMQSRKSTGLATAWGQLRAWKFIWTTPWTISSPESSCSRYYVANCS